jgi:hypothetical protein
MSTPSPVPPPTMIQQIETALSNALAKGKAEESKIWTWIKANWHHVVGYASIVAAIKKLI